MPHAFRLFRCMKRLGFPDDQAIAVGAVIELARQTDAEFRREQIIAQLVDAKFDLEPADAFCHLLRNCFASEKVATWFKSRSHQGVGILDDKAGRLPALASPTPMRHCPAQEATENKMLHIIGT